jgi:hypothetical protein
MVMHIAPEAERMTVVKTASRVLRSSGRLLIVEYGGPTRAGLVARHQMHRNFNLESLGSFLLEGDLTEIDRGPLGGLSLQYLIAEKR